MSASPSSKAASVPNITTLRNELDYGNSQLQRCMAFYDDIRVFRRKYRTSQGVPGLDLWDWKSREHQAGLVEMTQAYLEKEGNGRVFWPDEESSPYRNKYRYSTDHVQIKRLIKQLFFRLNQQQYRNAKYKHKDRPEDRTSPDERGRSVESAIDIDFFPLLPTSPSKSVSASSMQKSKPSNKAPASASKQRDFLKSRNVTSTAQQGTTSKKDVYAVPESESSLSPKIRSFEAINRDTDLRRNEKISAPAQPSHARTTKRAPTSASRKSNAESRKRKAAELDPEHLASWSPRSRKPVRREGYVGLEGMNEAIGDGSYNGGSPSLSINETNDLRATVEDVGDSEGDDFPTLTQLLEENHQPSTLRKEHAPLRQGTSDGGDVTASEKSQPHFEPIPMPSETGEASVQPQQQPPQHSTTVTPGPRPGSSLNQTKPSVAFIYRVIDSQSSSEKRVQTWQPRGRFQDKSLAELVEELPFDDPADVRGLVFTIDLPGMQAVEHILRENEDGFESMKRLINKSIRDWFTRRRRSAEDTGPARLVIDVFIETMGDENKEGIDKGDDLDMTWW